MKTLNEFINDEMSLENKLMDKFAKLSGYVYLPKGNCVTIKNLQNSSEYKFPEGYTCFLKYWEDKSGTKIGNDKCYCPNCDKEMSRKNDNIVGAHVYKVDEPNKWYVVPLCKDCNSSNNTDEMRISTKLVELPRECYNLK